jgi:hypothetical protein
MNQNLLRTNRKLTNPRPESSSELKELRSKNSNGLTTVEPVDIIRNST